MSIVLVRGENGHISSRKWSFQTPKNREFLYSELVNITDGFKHEIGEGGFGKVYRGTLEDGSEVAIKLLSQSSRQGYREFHAEAKLLMKVHHRNLVSLVGFCHEGDHMALVYEFMENGSLQKHKREIDVLSWKERLQIAADSARGLDYLHNGCKPPIIHRDLKPSNILLNENMEAKISDFGLSKAFVTDKDSYLYTGPAGTLGYLDPEYHSCGKLTKKSDVYSIGVVLLELITGKPAVITGTNNTHIIRWVGSLLERGDIMNIMDPNLQGNYDINSAWKVVEVAMACVQSLGIQRPDINYVYDELKECLEMGTKGPRRMEIDMSLTKMEVSTLPNLR